MSLAEESSAPGLVDERRRTMRRTLERLYPWCRSLTGPGTRATLAAIGERLPLRLVETPSRTPVFDWEVPDEWVPRAAHITDPSGRVLADLSDHS